MMPTNFSKKVLQIVASIPRGQLMTYSQIAIQAGSPRAYRAVGSILNRNYRQREWQLPLDCARGKPLDEFDPVPCHRVIRSDGFVGGYARGELEKERILKLEGHVIDKHRVRLPNIK